MFKKLLAGLTTVVLSLGLVSLTAVSASAHHSDVSATFACTSPTTGTITWTVHNWNGGKLAKVESSTGNIVPAGTEFASDQTKTFTQNVTAAGKYSLSVTMLWKNGDSWGNKETDGGSINVEASAFTSCDPNEQQKITICHANNGNGWVSNNVSVKSIINVPNGHAYHGEDIIPPFAYAGGTFPGLNWDEYGQFVYNNGCSNEVTPTTPTVTQAVCTADNQAGGASFTIVSATGVRFERSANGQNGWTEVAPGTHPVADGTSVWIRAVALPGYDLKGNDDNYLWRLTFTNVDEAKCEVPTAPTATAQVCTGAGTTNTASYTIPSDSGIRYQVRINGGAWQDVTGTPVTTDVTTFPTTVDVRALPEGGVTVVTGSTTSWTFDFVSAGDCKTIVPQPAQPSWTPFVCSTDPGEVTPGSYSVGAVANVRYFAGPTASGPWTELTAGQTYYPAADSTVFFTVELVNPATHTWAAGVQTTWSQEFVGAGDCKGVLPQPAAPAHSDFECTAEPGGVEGGSYTVPTTPGVTYEIRDGADWVVIPAGTYDAEQGETVEIRWVLTDPSAYKWADGVVLTPWSHTFNEVDCTVAATPVAPDFGAQTCVPNEDGGADFVDGWIEIPTTKGVDYFIGDSTTPATAGVHVVAPGVYLVSASAQEGYVLTGYTEPYEVEIKKAQYCGQLPEHPAVTPVVTFTQATCDAPARYTLAVDPADLAAGILWTVSGGLPNTVGTHAVTTAQTVTVSAKTAPGYGFDDGQEGPTREWTFEVTAPTGDCLPELPTLALTGGGIAGGALGLAALLAGAGILLVARRRDRMTAEQ